MMNPKAIEALKKARELFAQQVDDIPPNATPVEPIRRPQVHLIPTNAPKFNKETMKQEHKQEKQTDKYVEMSTRKAVQTCLDRGIKKPSDIAKETGKNVNQIYTALWHIKKAKNKAKLQAKPKSLEKADAMLARKKTFEAKASWGDMSDDFDPRREPTAWEDAHMVVLKRRAEYDAEIERLNQRISDLLIERQELNTIIKYLEGKVNG